MVSVGGCLDVLFGGAFRFEEPRPPPAVLTTEAKFGVAAAVVVSLFSMLIP